MATLIDYQGNKFEFEPLTFKQENLIKVNIKEDGTPNEGIWAVVSDGDKFLHDADLKCGRFVCMLVNHAVAFYPKPSWGLHIIAQWGGQERPFARLHWVDYTNKENRIYGPEVPETAKF